MISAHQRARGGPTEEAIEGLLRRHWRPGFVVSMDHTFDTIGLKGLDFIELIMEAETLFNLEISDEIATACRTPAQLALAIDLLQAVR